MKSKKMRVLSLTGAALLSLGCIAGCGQTSGGGDKNKTVLKIGVFNGGLGYQWAQELETAFEEKYKDVSFESGKCGVDVQIDPQKELFKVDSIKAAIEQNTSANDIYYTCYQFYKAFANTGLVYNLNDILNEKVYLDNGELADMTYNAETKQYVLKEGAAAPTKSLSDKMGQSWKDAFYYDDNQAITAGYYAIPYETSLEGFIYDYDLFQEKGWLVYDGIDGTPDTIEDFLDLLDVIKSADMIPYTFGDQGYWKGMQSAYMAQYEGYENAALNYTYRGEYTFRNLSESARNVFTKEFCSENAITDNGDGTYTVDISPSNAWLLAYQSGKDSYINFMRDITDPDYFDNSVFQESYDYTQAQTTFVLSKLGKKNQKRIAMIFEGEWWENEARTNFNYTGGYGTRDFRFMALPKIDGQIDSSVRSIGASLMGTDLVVNAKSDKLDLCRLWLQFSHSESALETFTLCTGAVRNAFEYDLSEEQQASLTKFGQNVYKIKKGLGEYANVNLVYPATYNKSNAFYNNTQMGGFGDAISSLCMGKYGTWDATGTFMIDWFTKHAGVIGNAWVSADTFIEEMYKYYSKAQWSSAFAAWQTQGA